MDDALVYRAARRLGVSPVEVDRMEMWQLAELFGANDPESDGPPSGNGRQVRSGRDLVAERVAHASGRGPKPEADSMDAGVSSLLNELGVGGNN